MAKIQCSLPWYAKYNNHWKWVTHVKGYFHTERFGVNGNHVQDGGYGTPFYYKLGYTMDVVIPNDQPKLTELSFTFDTPTTYWGVSKGYFYNFDAYVYDTEISLEDCGTEQYVSNLLGVESFVKNVGAGNVTYTVHFETPFYKTGAQKLYLYLIATETKDYPAVDLTPGWEIKYDGITYGYYRRMIKSASLESTAPDKPSFSSSKIDLLNISNNRVIYNKNLLLEWPEPSCDVGDSIISYELKIDDIIVETTTNSYNFNKTPQELGWERGKVYTIEITPKAKYGGISEQPGILELKVNTPPPAPRRETTEQIYIPKQGGYNFLHIKTDIDADGDELVLYTYYENENNTKITDGELLVNKAGFYYFYVFDGYENSEILTVEVLTNTPSELISCESKVTQTNMPFDTVTIEGINYKDLDNQVFTRIDYKVYIGKDRYNLSTTPAYSGSFSSLEESSFTIPVINDNLVAQFYQVGLSIFDGYDNSNSIFIFSEPQQLAGTLEYTEDITSPHITPTDIPEKIKGENGEEAVDMVLQEFCENAYSNNLINLEWQPPAIPLGYKQLKYKVRYYLGDTNKFTETQERVIERKNIYNYLETNEATDKTILNDVMVELASRGDLLYCDIEVYTPDNMQRIILPKSNGLIAVHGPQWSNLYINNIAYFSEYFNQRICIRPNFIFGQDQELLEGSGQKAFYYKIALPMIENEKLLDTVALYYSDKETLERITEPIQFLSNAVSDNIMPVNGQTAQPYRTFPFTYKEIEGLYKYCNLEKDALVGPYILPVCLGITDIYGHILFSPTVNLEIDFRERAKELPSIFEFGTDGIFYDGNDEITLTNIANLCSNSYIVIDNNRGFISKEHLLLFFKPELLTSYTAQLFSQYKLSLYWKKAEGDYILIKTFSFSETENNLDKLIDGDIYGKSGYKCYRFLAPELQEYGSYYFTLEVVDKQIYSDNVTKINLPFVIGSPRLDPTVSLNKSATQVTFIPPKDNSSGDIQVNFLSEVISLNWEILGRSALQWENNLGNYDPSCKYTLQYSFDNINYLQLSDLAVNSYNYQFDYDNKSVLTESYHNQIYLKCSIEYTTGLKYYNSEIVPDKHIVESNILIFTDILPTLKYRANRVGINAEPGQEEIFKINKHQNQKLIVFSGENETDSIPDVYGLKFDLSTGQILGFTPDTEQNSFNYLPLLLTETIVPASWIATSAQVDEAVVSAISFD